MNPEKIFEQIERHFDSVVLQDSELGKELWRALTSLHPADIAAYMSNVSKDQFVRLYATFPQPLQIEIFHYLSDSYKAYTLSVVEDKLKAKILESMSLDEFTDLVGLVDKEELAHYFKLMRKKDRNLVISLMKFGPDSAGGVMDINVISLSNDLTVSKSIVLLQKLQPKKELHDVIYVTDNNNKLMGHINLEDLVMHSPKTQLSSFIKQNEYVAHADEDQELVAQKMLHYHLTTVPVVSKEDQFLGVIPSETLAEILEEEGAEDVYRISAMSPIKHTYFETPFFKLLFERGYILVILLLIESFASIILHAHEATIPAWLFVFLTMLVSVGGNTSSQTSAVVIQGLASGEINFSNAPRFLRREFLMAMLLALVLGVTAFARVFFSTYSTIGSFIIAITTAAIVLTSVVLGSLVPLILKRIGSDPAFSAGPFLATVMDILGILMFCYIVKIILM
ncbi:magnesium transporter [bacterium]|jgi:magnesium transporter|nr:magnesium transporter [bacterium]MBT5015056.1 magnesium transporter [bacterium]